MGEHVPVGVDTFEVRGDLVVSERVLRDLKLDRWCGVTTVPGAGSWFRRSTAS